MTSNASRIRELNDTIRYTMWSVFKVSSPLGPSRPEAAAEIEELIGQLAGKDVLVRGLYDVAGLRADADFMIWWHAPTADLLQDAYAAFRHTSLGQHPLVREHQLLEVGGPRLHRPHVQDHPLAHAATQ